MLVTEKAKTREKIGNGHGGCGLASAAAPPLQILGVAYQQFLNIYWCGVELAPCVAIPGFLDLHVVYSLCPFFISAFSLSLSFAPPKADFQPLLKRLDRKSVV